MNNQGKKRLRILVSGRVQGVFFRGSTNTKAKELGLTGWVKNLSDGRVEAVFEGEEGAVNKIISWARRGPVFAKVEDLRVIEENYCDEFTSFQIK